MDSFQLILVLYVLVVALFASVVYLLVEARRFDGKVGRQDDALVENIVGSLTERMREQDARIAEMQVKVDIVEMRLGRSSVGSRSRESMKTMDESIVIKPAERKTDGGGLGSGRLGELNESEAVVLRALADGAKTPAEIMVLLKCTREHSSRMMKSLFERNLVSRDAGKRPFVYSISEAGRKVIGVM